jgi:galactokinase/mevalonate kinase-like predicted kinase
MWIGVRISAGFGGIDYEHFCNTHTQTDTNRCIATSTYALLRAPMQPIHIHKQMHYYEHLCNPYTDTDTKRCTVLLMLSSQQREVDRTYIYIYIYIERERESLV